MQDFDVDARIGARKVRDDGRQHMGAKPVGRGYAEGSAKLLLPARKPPLHGERALFHLLRERDDGAAFLGQDMPVSGALEQRLAGRLLERAEAPADSGMAETERARRFAQRAGPHDGQKDAYVAPLHVISSSLRITRRSPAAGRSPPPEHLRAALRRRVRQLSRRTGSRERRRRAAEGKMPSASSFLAAINPLPSPRASCHKPVDSSRARPGVGLAVPIQPMTARLTTGSSSMPSAAMRMASRTRSGCVEEGDARRNVLP